MIIQLLGLGHLADSALDREVNDAFAVLNRPAPAPDRLLMLNANEPEGIIRWCHFILSEPADRALSLARPLYPVMDRLTDESALAVGQVLRWALLDERPWPR